jgi:hypothetical protein
MFEFNGGKKKKLLFTGILGVITVSSYILAISQQDYLTQISTRGGWNFIWPVTAAFYFSFLHGTFASNVLSILGITASKKRPADRITASRTQPAEQKKAPQRQAQV